MKLLSYINKLTVLAAVLTLLALPSCIADPIAPDNPVEDPSIASGKKILHYLAFQLNAADNSSLSTNWDSDDNDPVKDAANTTIFDKGLKAESALYFPEKPEEETDEIPSEGVSEDNPQAIDEDGDEDGEGNENDEEEEEVDTNEQMFHFAIIFKTDDGSRVSDLVPLELKFKENKEDVTVYSKFYGPEEENPYKHEDEISVLVVLNASWDLQKKMQEKLATAASKYDDIRELTLDNSIGSDPDNFLYLKDKKGNYILDKDGNRYFTMTSSIIIKEGEVVPAIETTSDNKVFKTYNTLKEAEDNATDIYVERLAAKSTVVFYNRSRDQYFYLKPKDNTSIAAGSFNSLSTRGNTETGYKEDPIGTDHLVLKNGLGADQLKIVTQYDRNPSITQRKEPNIKTSEEWWANIIGWDINALEKEQYIFKNLSATNYYDGWDQDKNNNPLSYRTLWAEDIHYDTGTYPHQTRRAIEKFSLEPDLEGHEVIYSVPLPGIRDLENTLANSASLGYFSYNDLSKRDIRRYAPENTFSYNLLLNQGTSAIQQDPYHDQVYLRTGSHLIVTAQLLIRGFDSDYLISNEIYDENTGLLIDQGNQGAASKFYMNGIYWTQQAYMEYAAEYLGYFMQDDSNQAENVFGRNDGIFYVNKNGVMTPAKGTDFILESASVKGGDNLVYITPNTTLYVYNYDEAHAVPEEEGEEDSDIPSTDEPTDDPADEPQDIDEADSIPVGYHEISYVNYINLVYAHRELMAARYNEGRMYYVKGCEHNQNSPNFGPNALYRVSTGDYGMVRNNWYNYVVKSVSKPGTGVDIETQPIVPNNYDGQGIGVSFEVLDWHNVYTSVDPGGQKRPGIIK